MRPEVRDFMKQCERLLSLALQTKELSEDECEIISYYANELHQKTDSLCTRERERPRV